ncbi:hypothetical protein MBLNU230_g8043t1 [Neophaeotheca triangularis]
MTISDMDGVDSEATPVTGDQGPRIIHKLDLKDLPPVFVSATHFETDDLHELEDELTEFGVPLTYDPNEAKVVLTKSVKKPRIKLDLRAKGLWTEDIEVTDHSTLESTTELATKKRKHSQGPGLGSRQAKALVIDDESTASEDESKTSATQREPISVHAQSGPSTDVIKVVKIAWFEESKRAGRCLPLDDFLVYQGRRTPKPESLILQKEQAIPINPKKPISTSSQKAVAAKPKVDHVLERAMEDASNHPPKGDNFAKRKFGRFGGKSATGNASWSAGKGNDSQYAHLLKTTTSEYDAGQSEELPEMPEWVKAGIKYACQRPTPANNPNDPFIKLLKTIKTARLLTNDEIGVRAYSTSIASLAAYPYKVSNPREILALPGCDAKIANLFVEWTNTGQIKAVEDVEADEDLKILRLFYEIWGVGATTAREFYYDRGWRELDDIVEYGWSTLSRVQQIGVKYYDEFLDLIPRAEVEEIARIIHQHAVKVRDDRIQTMLVGGYRRGKDASGDVDIVVSHPDEEQTLNIVNDIVASLEEEGWITHTLLLSLNSTNRGQQTLPFRTGGGGHGFDTLDKALVVWQDPRWPSQEADLAANPKAKNPNIHRRVDIIISPWRTVGCAVAGWSSGTTFQRDLRRYAKNVKGWKFDSSGVRDRGNGEVVDVEGWSEDGRKAFGWRGNAETMGEAERRVFEGMGLPFWEPWDRCTG